MSSLLSLENLTIEVAEGENKRTIVDVDALHVEKGEFVAVVGETGSGKTMMASSIIQLFPSKKISIAKGRIVFEDQDLLTLSKKELVKVRGKKIAMIFQDPMTALNPVFRIGDLLEEVIQTHHNVPKKEIQQRAVEAFQFVGLPGERQFLRRYPHELSGGQRQRVVIAMAIACEANLIIADEPTTALDVSTQAQILDLMKKLQREKHTSVLFITHNLGVVSEMADRVVIMYKGKIVEQGNTKEVFDNPTHPYTNMLLSSIPRINETRKRLPIMNTELL